MKTCTLIAICIFIFPAITVAQDTIKVEPSVYYSSANEPYRGKEFASRVKYAREDIVFSNTHKKIEYCYYYDNKRNCYGKTYRLSSDSVLHVLRDYYDNDTLDEETWIYRPEGNHYFVYRYLYGAYEYGRATSLMPFEQDSFFITTTEDKLDTLWTTDYTLCKASGPLMRAPKYSYPQTTVTGKIYQPSQITSAPTFINGDTISGIKLNYDGGCACGPMEFVRTMTFVITENGRIVNIQQGLGNIDMKFCPFYVMDLMRLIYQLGPVKPATRHGKAVNVLWPVSVDMGREKDW